MQFNKTKNLDIKYYLYIKLLYLSLGQPLASVNQAKM